MKQLFTNSVRAAGVLALVPVFYVVATAEPSTRLSNLKLEGAWTTTYTADPGQPALPPLQPATSLTLFNREGGLVTLQNAIGPPMMLVTSGIGEWAISGDNQFAGTVLFAVASVDAAGNGHDAGFFKQRWTVSYNPTRDQVSGPYQFALLDPNGNVVFQGSGTITMKRVGVEPMANTW
jgi:hypothetical protein